jgi:hypothetical protein
MLMASLRCCVEDERGTASPMVSDSDSGAEQEVKKAAPKKRRLSKDGGKKGKKSKKSKVVDDSDDEDEKVRSSALSGVNMDEWLTSGEWITSAPNRLLSKMRPQKAKMEAVATRTTTILTMKEGTRTSTRPMALSWTMRTTRTRTTMAVSCYLVAMHHWLRNELGS